MQLLLPYIHLPHILTGFNITYSNFTRKIYIVLLGKGKLTDFISAHSWEWRILLGLEKEINEQHKKSPEKQTHIFVEI